METRVPGGGAQWTKAEGGTSRLVAGEKWRYKLTMVIVEVKIKVSKTGDIV